MPNSVDQIIPEPLTIGFEHPGTGTTVCTVRGEIDMATETTFRTGLERIVGGAAPLVVVDLGGVTFIGSVAAAIIDDVFRRLSEVQALKVVTGQSSVRLFEMLGLGQIVDCFPDRSAI